MGTIVNMGRQKEMSSMYDREQTLVDDFMVSLGQSHSSPWGPLDTATEFFYARGRTDVVARTTEGEIIAFEAKLTKWRDAVHQAYRNTCFAHRSYILLPEQTAATAARYVGEFAKRSVGLCYMSDGQVVVALEAPRVSPLQSWLSDQATAICLRNNNGQ